MRCGSSGSTHRMIMKLLLFVLLSALHILAYDWHEETDHIWAEQCEWNGNDLINVKSTEPECGPKCASTSDCTHFTWTGYQGGTCWLKKNAINESQATTPSEYSICGYMKTSPNLTDTGLIYLSDPAIAITTTYWDCCKVSCAWNGKANVTVPVQSCQKDGKTGIDMNAGTGCSGGPSFVCNSNQPWVINENLSYGFAGAKLTDQSVKDWCCACYELTFTTGAAKGKRMVVQATNSGDDYINNQFDLQMPGGGVGYFTEGCKNQWNAPSGGWGPQYGGVTSRDQCNQLPQVLQLGCFWRFDWFKNAFIPLVSFRRVKCPAELTQKTGCKRNDE